MNDRFHVKRTSPLIHNFVDLQLGNNVECWGNAMNNLTKYQAEWLSNGTWHRMVHQNKLDASWNTAHSFSSSWHCNENENRKSNISPLPFAFYSHAAVPWWWTALKSSLPGCLFLHKKGTIVREILIHLFIKALCNDDVTQRRFKRTKIGGWETIEFSSTATLSNGANLPSSFERWMT